jgi:hypothetical protein
LFLLEQLVVVGVGLDPRVLLQGVEDIADGVAHGDEFNIGVGAEHGEMGQAHLAEADHGKPYSPCRSMTAVIADSPDTWQS